MIAADCIPNIFQKKKPVPNRTGFFFNLIFRNLHKKMPLSSRRSGIL